MTPRPGADWQGWLGVVGLIAMIGGIALLCTVTGLGADVAEPLCLAAIVGLVIWLRRSQGHR